MGVGSIVDILDLVLFLKHSILGLTPRIFILLLAFPLISHYWHLLILFNLFLLLLFALCLDVRVSLGQFADDRAYWAVLDHHFLVVRVALGGSAGLDVLAESEICFLEFAFHGRQAHDHSLFFKEFEIGSVFAVAPVIVGILGLLPHAVLGLYLKEDLLFRSLTASYSWWDSYFSERLSPYC